MSFTYALVIGVDYYGQSGGVSSLNGCVRDAERLASYLEETIPPEKLRLKRMYSTHEEKFDADFHAGQAWKNDYAKDSAGTTPPTRVNILHYLDAHFRDAKKEDQVVIFYAGHGSQETAHAYFTGNAGTGKLQTLVPCDARMNLNGKTGPAQRNVRDIMDKEMRVLLHRIWKRGGEGPEILVLQDSCHSEAATRSADDLKKKQAEIAAQSKEFALETPALKARWTDPDSKARVRSFSEEEEGPQVEELARFMRGEGSARPAPAAATGSSPAASGANMGNRPPFEEAFPEAPHVHISACGRAQYAYETAFTIPETGERGQAGVFTHTLLDILRKSKGKISYRELLQRVRLGVDGLFEQSPSLHAFPSTKQFQGFLSAEKDEYDYYGLVHRDLGDGQSEWLLEIGAVHGLSVLKRGQTIEIEVFDQDKPLELIPAKIDYVMPGHSRVVFEPDIVLDTAKLYMAKISPNTLNPRKLILVAEEKVEQALQKALKDSIHINFIRPEQAAQRYEKNAVDRLFMYEIWSRGTTVSLFKFTLDENSPERLPIFSFKTNQPEKELATSYIALANCLERINRWENQVYLLNPHPDSDEIAALANLEFTSVTGKPTFISLNLRDADDAKALIQNLETAYNKVSYGEAFAVASSTEENKRQTKEEQENTASQRKYSLHRIKVTNNTNTKPVYINAIALKPHYEITTLNKIGGEILLPKGSLNLEESKVAGSVYFPKRENAPKEYVYVKIYLSYYPIDLSLLIQDAIPIPGSDTKELETNSSFRGSAKSFVRIDQMAGDWACYLIPFEISDSHSIKDNGWA